MEGLLALYTSSAQFASLGGAVILSPNALRILDTLGIYEQIGEEGFNFNSVSSRDEHENELNKFYFGSQALYNYDAIRIKREIVVRELLVAEQKGIDVRFDIKFTRIISPDDSVGKGLQLEFADGSIESAALLIGADGIHSRVRRQFFPVSTPVFSGQAAITCLIERPKLRFPQSDSYKLPAVIHAKNGAFLLIPQSKNGEEVQAGRQWKFEERDRAEPDGTSWEQRKTSCWRYSKADFETWPETVQSCLNLVQPEGFAIWPYYTLPRLENGHRTPVR
jgi:2-polyprenyl-6-methoxyphenol hydroxylase-like FAD-dependent oxidoreductase